MAWKKFLAFWKPAPRDLLGEGFDGHVGLALHLLAKGRATQKELQVVGGGLVCIAMFNRPLLCGLNQIWREIVRLDDFKKGTRAALRREVCMNFRGSMSRPSSTPYRRPAGLKQCQAHEVERWKRDLHRFPPISTGTPTACFLQGETLGLPV